MNNATANTLALEALPKCVANCLLQYILPAGCTVSNFQSCYCTNIPLNHAVASCVQLNCTVVEQGAGLDSSQSSCAGYPIQTQTWHLLIPLITLDTLDWIFILARFYVCWRITRRFGWDDWSMVFAAIFHIVESIVAYVFIGKGLGKHVWNIDYKDIPALEKLFFTANLLYLIDQVAVKTSVVFTYLRIFQDKTFRRICWGTQIALWVLTLVYLFLLFFRCNPISDSWDKALNTGNNCLPYRPLLVSAGFISIFEDVWILLLPIPQLWRVNVASNKKVQLILIFNIGAFACVTSMIRLKYLFMYRENSTDATYDNVDLVFWTIIELGMAYTCANLVSLRPLLRAMAPGIFGANISSSGRRRPYSTNPHSDTQNSLNSTGFKRIDSPVSPTDYVQNEDGKIVAVPMTEFTPTRDGKIGMAQGHAEQQGKGQEHRRQASWNFEEVEMAVVDTPPPEEEHAPWPLPNKR